MRLPIFWRQYAIYVLGIVCVACSSPVIADEQSFSNIENGRMLAVAGDCAACHTGEKGIFAGGKPIGTPFGTVLGSNITPDRETGIGAWSDDEFVNAVRNGIGHNGRHLYPAMPYVYFTKMTKADVLAIRAYLNTLAPVNNRVRSNRLPFPFRLRFLMVGWNALFFSSGTFQPVQGKSAEWNRGAYLVEGAGHCGACHTEKNLLGGDHTNQPLQGGKIQGWFAPDLTSDSRHGLGSWSIEEIVSYLKTGRNSKTAAVGTMAEVISDSTSHIPETDLRAIAVYLKDQPAKDAGSQQPISESDSAMKTGAGIYADNCEACHSATGMGSANLFTELKGNPSVQSADATSIIRVVLEGARSVGTDAAPTAAAMPAQGWKLSDQQIAAVTTYIRNSWGNAASSVSAGDVTAVRDSLKKTMN